MKSISLTRIGIHKMNKKKKRLLTIDLLFMILLIMADQFSKYFAVANLRNHEPWVLWEGVFELHYLENRGAAFGMLQDQKVLFILIAVIILAVIMYVLVKTPYQKMYTKLHITLVLIAAGAIGNLIDRLRYDYVVDFLYFSLINFPIFNVADIYVTCSCVLALILIFFYYEDEEFNFLFGKEKRKTP